jgi:hypothetical protein
MFASARRMLTARKLGCVLLTRTMERRHQVGLDSYDRFFPNQDTMPKGGFGNLIALPLQRAPRKQDNSVFIDPDFHPYPDQWQFLSTIRRMPVDAAEEIVAEALVIQLAVLVAVAITFWCLWSRATEYRPAPRCWPSTFGTKRSTASANPNRFFTSRSWYSACAGRGASASS